MDENTGDVIKIGDYIIVQRQKFAKLYKFASLETTVNLGKVNELFVFARHSLNFT